MARNLRNIAAVLVCAACSSSIACDSVTGPERYAALLRALTSAEAVWAGLNQTHYVMFQERQQLPEPSPVDTAHVEVWVVPEGYDRLVAWRDEGHNEYPHLSFKFASVSQLFRLIHTAVDDRLRVVEAEFDPVYGYPVYVHVESRSGGIEFKSYGLMELE